MNLIEGITIILLGTVQGVILVDHVIDQAVDPIAGLITGLTADQAADLEADPEADQTVGFINRLIMSRLWAFD